METTKMKIKKQINWLKVFIDLWSRAYVSSDESETHQKNMQNALYHFCEQYKLPIMSADELIDYIKVKRLVEYIAKDYQLDLKDSRYMGFINIEPKTFGKYKKSMVNLVYKWEYYIDLLKEYNLKFESKPCVDEMILIHTPKIKVTITIESI
jgi:hypothetical protein